MRVRPVRTGLLLLTACVAGWPVSAQCPDGQENRTVFGQRQTPSRTFTASGSLPVGSQQDRMRYFRLELRREPDSTANGLLIVKDDDLRVVDVLRLADLPVGSSVWSRRGVGNRASLRFAVPPGETPRVTVVRTIAMPVTADGPTYYSLQIEGLAAYRPVYPSSEHPPGSSARARLLADSVGFVQASHVGGEQSWCCSAVAVGADLILTNWHCGGDASMLPDDYWDEDVCSQTLIDMSWDGDGTSREFQCERVVADRRLDLALLRVKPVGEAQPLVPVEFAAGDSPVDHVDLVHHPACKAKQVTENCAILALGPDAASLATEFTHDCDAEQGSSGAPLFAAGGNRPLLVGLHHAGFRRDPADCAPLDRVNRGVRLPELRQFIADAQARLVQP